MSEFATKIFFFLLDATKKFKWGRSNNINI
jgi:hypothetical protein